MFIGKELYNFFFKQDKKIDIKDIEDFCEKIKKILIKADLNQKCINEIMLHFKKKAKELCIQKKDNIHEIMFNYLHAIIRVILKMSLLGKFNLDLHQAKKIVFYGLSGAGKTSAIPKVANFLFNKKICCIRYSLNAAFSFQDVQLRNLCLENNISYFKMPESLSEKNEKIKELQEIFDIILIDTDPIHNEKEATNIKKAINFLNADLSVFVADSLGGKLIFDIIENFVKILKIDGFIISKTDSSSRFGLIFHISYLLKLPIFFLTNGERVHNIEKYNPDKVAFKLLGIEDKKRHDSLMRSSKKLEKEKIVTFKNKFNFNDLYQKIEEISNNYGILKINTYFSFKKKKNLTNEDKFKKTLINQLAIIKSMTNEERESPEILNHSRIGRIAKGSGCLAKEVISLLEEFNKIKNELS